MPSLKKRSYQRELLDDAQIPFQDIKRNMQDLDLINQRHLPNLFALTDLKQTNKQAPKIMRSEI